MSPGLKNGYNHTYIDLEGVSFMRLLL